MGAQDRHFQVHLESSFAPLYLAALSTMAEEAAAGAEYAQDGARVEAEMARSIAAAKCLAEWKKDPKSGEIVENEHYVFFWKPPSAFDQWSPCTFEVDGTVYNCAEQFMMAEKARLFGDLEMRARILAELYPLEQKKLGSKPSSTRWSRKSWEARSRASAKAFGSANVLESLPLGIARNSSKMKSCA